MPSAYPTYEVGDRIELHPATDMWMQGIRFGTVVSVKGNDSYQVKLDRLDGDVKFIHASNIGHKVGS